MEVFFLRHGQTNGNIARRHQHSNTPLNEMGERQAREVAPKIATLVPTHFISSTHLRAIETTRIVAQVCNIIPDTHPAFEELDRPLWLVGRHYIGLTTTWYVIRWFFGLPVDSGESYEAFVRRIKGAQAHLESLPADARVVVVSHAVFVNIFLAHICVKGRLSVWGAVKSFLNIFSLRNTGIVHLHYEPNINTSQCGWSIIER